MNPTRKLNRKIRRKGMCHCRTCKAIVMPERKYFEDGSYVWICPKCKYTVRYKEVE